MLYKMQKRSYCRPTILFLFSILHIKMYSLHDTYLHNFSSLQIPLIKKQCDCSVYLFCFQPSSFHAGLPPHHNIGFHRDSNSAGKQDSVHYVWLTLFLWEKVCFWRETLFELIWLQLYCVFWQPKKLSPL